MIVLERPEWQQRAREHRERIMPLVAPRLVRRKRGERHPVDDFLFEYYSYRPGQLLTWHPGFGVGLVDAPEFRGRRGYEPVDGSETVLTASVSGLREAAPRLSAAIALLEATASRTAEFGCFGRHEWAMVYRTNDIRHERWPLRLAAEQIAEVVESSPLRCTHFDAFRFYSDAARPLNVVQPSRAMQVDLEQPGCLHAGMDLYRWAFTLSPWVGSDLVADCFEHARRIRTLDMQVAPYDLAALGVEPVRIETPQGRAEFARAQREFAAASAVLRERLLGELRRLNSHVVSAAGTPRIEPPAIALRTP